MTLEDLKNTLQTFALSHRLIGNFDYGEDALVATNAISYPKLYLEIPYNISYNIQARSKTIRFAFLVLMPVQHQDDVAGDHRAISVSETVADSIVARLQEELKTSFAIDSVNAISLRNFSDDNVAGIRVEIEGRTTRAYCANTYKAAFK